MTITFKHPWGNVDKAELTRDLLKNKTTLYKLKKEENLNEVLNIIKNFPSILSTKASAEEMERIVQNIMSQLLELLEEIEESENEEEESVENSLAPPLPPGTVDPNATGIPDNSRKDVDSNLIDQVLDTDEKPNLDTQIYGVKEGDWVSWESPLGRSYGQVKDIVDTGIVEIPDSNLVLTATHDDPVTIVQIFRNDKGQGWIPTDTAIGLKMSALKVIDPLEAPSIPPDVLPNVQNSLKEVIEVKGLNLKAVDGKLRGNIQVKFKSADNYKPNLEELNKINQFSLKTLTEDDLYCFELQSADMEVDRGFEQFSSSAIDKMAILSPNKPVLMDHQWSVQTTVGKIYEAFNENGKLIQKAYFPVTENNKNVIENILNGLYNKLSVGFAASPENMVCSVCTRSMFDMNCKHQPGELLKNGSPVTLIYKDVDDYFEVSLVAVPMQQDAHIRQQTLKSLDTLKEKDSINLEENKLISPTPDTIINGKDTIKDSLSMSDENIVKEDITHLQPKDSVDPHASNDEVDEMRAVHDKLDDQRKMIGMVHEAHENLKQSVEKMVGHMHEMHEHLKDAMQPKMDDVHVKAGDMHPKMDEVYKMVKDEAMARQGLEKGLEEVKKILELNIHLSTEGVKRLLSEDNVEQAPSDSKKKIWINDYFGVKQEDSGGQ